MSRSIYGSPEWLARSAQVTRGARCVNCRTPRDLVAHHKIPRSYGGRDDLSNLQPVCRECHPELERRAVLAAIRAGRRKIAPAARPAVKARRKPVVRRKPVGRRAVVRKADAPPAPATQVATLPPSTLLAALLDQRRHGRSD